MKSRCGLLAAFTLLCLAAGCGKQQEEAARGAPAIQVSVAQAESRDVEIVEQSIGTVESEHDPMIGAEVAGRVTDVLVNAGDQVQAGQVLVMLDARDLQLRRSAARAEMNRVRALLVEQGLTVARNRQLLDGKFISESILDASLAQETALREQLAGAEAQAALAERDLAKARITAPHAARVEARLVAPGDYIQVGDPLLRLVAADGLRVRLPFPEAALSKLGVGQKVRMASPVAPDQPVEGRIAELRPMVGEANRAVDAFVVLEGAASWRAGASVNATVITDRRAGSIVVPEIAVVIRPAGTVVYTVKDNVAVQNIVTTGVSRDGWVEILSGVPAGQKVVVDGAGFLSDRAAVAVKEQAP